MAEIALSPRVGGQSIGESALEPADIIVSTTPATVSRVIRTATGSPVSHAILYIGNGSVIEAIGEGVVQRPLSAAVREASLAVAYRRRSLAPTTAATVIQYARGFVGRKYDTLGAVGAGSRSVSPLTCVLALGIVGCAAARSGGFNSRDRFFCSELVLEAFRRAGVPLTQTAPSMAAPDSLVQAHSRGLLLYVGHLKA